MGHGEMNGGTKSPEKKITVDQIKKLDKYGNGSAIDGSESSPLLSTSNFDPVDTCHLAYIIFYLHGVGHLLPWNFFITATQVGVTLR